MLYRVILLNRAFAEDISEGFMYTGHSSSDLYLVSLIDICELFQYELPWNSFRDTLCPSKYLPINAWNWKKHFTQRFVTTSPYKIQVFKTLSELNEFNLGKKFS